MAIFTDDNRPGIGAARLKPVAQEADKEDQPRITAPG